MAVLTVGTGYTYSTVQAAVNAASAGDVIKCKAGQTFTETVTLTNKGTLASYITITTDAASGSLPAAGVRTGPAYLAFMPTIQSPGSGACTFLTEPGANHYKLQHLHLPEVPQGFNAIVALGANDSTQEFRSQQPDYITVDQCYLHGGAVCGQKRAFQLNLKHCTITNNYASDIKSVAQDSQCIQGCNGEGPYVIENNNFNAGTTPFLIGGDDPNIRTRMTVTGSASSTGAAVSCSDSGHTLSELRNGQEVAVKVGGTYEVSNLTSITGSGSTGTLTWAPALSGAADTPGSIKAGIILGDRLTGGETHGLTFRHNWVHNDPTWINKTLATPTGVSAVASTSSGTLAAGTKYYKIQAFSANGYQGNFTWGDLSAEASATLAATGHITVTYTGVAGATVYRVWRGTSSGGQNEWIDSTSSPFVDTGALSWTSSGTFGGQSWQIKNLFELKAAQNWLVEKNIFENCWRGSDVGFAIWLKTVNQGGDAPYLKTTNGTFQYNIIRHCYGLFEVHGRERGDASYQMPAPLDGLVITHNLCYDSNGTWGQGQDAKYAVDVTEGALNVDINHNHLIHTSGNGHLSMRSGVDACTGFQYRNNLGLKLAFGLHDNDGTYSEGTNTLSGSTGGSYTYTKNAIADISSGSYPANNFDDAFATWSAKFTFYTADGADADYTIRAVSNYHHAGTDGLDLGADILAVLAGTLDVLSGTPTAPPDVTPAAPGCRVDMQLTPGVWTTNTDVLISDRLSCRRGQSTGSAPTDRVASPGTCEFALRNDAGNSASLLGYYSPNHANCRAGFTYGIPIRFVVNDGTDHVLWTGKLRTIDPVPGTHRSRRTLCIAQDIFADLTEAAVREISPQVDQQEDGLIQAILDALPPESQPTALDLDTGLDTFAYALYNTGDGVQAIGLLNDVAVSVLGWIYPTGDGTFTYENRHTRALKASAYTLSGDTDGEDLIAATSLDTVYNHVRVTIHPPTITPNVVLYASEGPTEIAPGQTVTIWGTYQNADNQLQLIGGTDFTLPLVAHTDYAANSVVGGDGNDLTDSLTVTVTPFAATAKFDLTNTTTNATMYVGGVAGILQLRGTGIFDNAAQTYESFATMDYGDRPLDVDLPFQDDPNLAQDMADYLKTLYSAPVIVTEVSLAAHGANARMTQALTREIGDVIVVSETVTGTTAVAVAIQGIAVEVINGTVLRVTWSVAPAAIGRAFILDDATYGVLDGTVGLLAYA